jgi:hypothetical protein
MQKICNNFVISFRWISFKWIKRMILILAHKLCKTNIIKDKYNSENNSQILVILNNQHLFNMNNPSIKRSKSIKWYRILPSAAIRKIT